MSYLDDVIQGLKNVSNPNDIKTVPGGVKYLFNYFKDNKANQDQYALDFNRYDTDEKAKQFSDFLKNQQGQPTNPAVAQLLARQKAMLTNPQGGNAAPSMLSQGDPNL